MEARRSRSTARRTSSARKGSTSAKRTTAGRRGTGAKASSARKGMTSGTKVALAAAAGVAAATVAGLATSKKGRAVARSAKSRVKKMMDSPTARSVRKTIADTYEQVMHGDSSDGTTKMPKSGPGTSRPGMRRPIPRASRSAR